ncbi:hypothetical protein [Nocardioides lentus]|uniref:hypothetical protein n=1 Tax=Nocardioides lentus TaxID=338077 RepID=UPI0031DECCB8
MRDHLASWLSSRASGVAKVDLVLRGLAVVESEGLLDPDIRWDEIHDLIRPHNYYGDDRKLKRNWLGQKLERLEAENLLARAKSPGGRTRLHVLRDDASQLPLDDPGAAGDGYVSVLGDIFHFERIAPWGSPELSAYFACMIAERYSRTAAATAVFNEGRPWGGGIWFRELKWFADPAGLRPSSHVRVPFAERTLRRGLVSLRSENLVATVRIYRDPRTGERFKQPQGRLLYRNGFSDLRSNRGVRARDLAMWAKGKGLIGGGP